MYELIKINDNSKTIFSREMKQFQQAKHMTNRMAVYPENCELKLIK